MILLLIGCENEHNKEFGEKGVPNLTGNSYGNIINNGFVAKQDNLLIYMKYNDSNIPLISNNAIMIKEEDGTNEVKLTSKGFGDLNVLE